MHILWEIFISFFKVGLFTFGGGGAMIPLLEDELVKKRGWLTEQDLIDYYAIAQCTPGIIAINTATMAGYVVKKKIGSLIATVAVVLPSLIIITLIAAVMQNFMEYQSVIHAFNGIRAAVVAIIFQVVFTMWKKNIKQVSGGIIFIASLLLLIFFEISPIQTIIFGFGVGMLWQFFTKIHRSKK